MKAALAATLPVCAAGTLAFAALAQGSNARSIGATGLASATAQSFCAGLEQGISADMFRFSGWRCRQGPAVRGHETILGWVTMTKTGGSAHVELVWLVETQPVLDAQVIDARNVPRYGYEPSDVRAAFRAPAGDQRVA
jgi:hypothetical protein